MLLPGLVVLCKAIQLGGNAVGKGLSHSLCYLHSSPDLTTLQFLAWCFA